MKTLALILVFALGYGASIYSWPWLQLKVKGAEAIIASLEAKVKALRAGTIQ